MSQVLRADSSTPPPFPTLRVSPAVGKSMSRFTFSFRSEGSDPFDPGYAIRLRGPSGTRCTNLEVGASQGLATEAGRYRVVMGPGLPVDPENADAPTIRAAPTEPDSRKAIRRWCPGRYVGVIEQIDRSRFSFCVRGASCAPPPPRCRLRGGRLQAARGPSSIWSAGGYPFVLYGCYARGRPAHLGGSNSYGGGASLSARLGALAGRFGAVIQHYQCCGLGSDSLRVYDLRKRSLLRKSAAKGDGAQIESLVLARSGAAAYTIQVNDSRVAQVWQVRSLDDAGEHVLDAGPTVVAGSLARDGDGNITWRNGSHLRTATLR